MTDTHIKYLKLLCRLCATKGEPLLTPAWDRNRSRPAFLGKLQQSSIVNV